MYHHYVGSDIKRGKLCGSLAGRELAMHGIQVSFGLQSGGISSGAGELTSLREALPLGILVCCLTKLLAALAAYICIDGGLRW
jgi:hypothetical protein